MIDRSRLPLTLRCWHHDGSGEQLTYKGRLREVDGCLRFVCEWKQDRKRMSLTLTSRDDCFYGTFGHPGEEVPVMASMTARGRHTWEFVVSGKPPGAPPWVGPIVARALKPKGQGSLS